MTINFGGFKNAGGFFTATEKEITQHNKVWAQLTDEKFPDRKEFGPLLKKYPDSENLGFVRVVVSAENVPIKDSFISINNKSKKFDDLTKEDIPFVMMVKKMLSKIADSKNELPINKDYLDSEDALKNVEIKKEDFRDEDRKEILSRVHDSKPVKILSKRMENDIMNKLTETFSRK